MLALMAGPDLLKSLDPLPLEGIVGHMGIDGAELLDKPVVKFVVLFFKGDFGIIRCFFHVHHLTQVCEGLGYRVCISS